MGFCHLLHHWGCPPLCRLHHVHARSECCTSSDAYYGTHSSGAVYRCSLVPWFAQGDLYLFQLCSRALRILAGCVCCQIFISAILGKGLTYCGHGKNRAAICMFARYNYNVSIHCVLLVSACAWVIAQIITSAVLLKLFHVWFHMYRGTCLPLPRSCPLLTSPFGSVAFQFLLFYPRWSFDGVQENLRKPA